MTAPRGAVFLDRDGVLNERPAPHEYVTSRDAFRWLPGAAGAVGRIAAAGLPVFVVSNQRGVARGLVSTATLTALESEIQGALEHHGAHITAFYYCPHALEDGCDCRKPSPGLLLRAAREHGVALSESVMVGDSESDVEAGRAAGCATIRIAPAGTPSAAGAVVPTLDAAASLLTR